MKNIDILKKEFKEHEYLLFHVKIPEFEEMLMEDCPNEYAIVANHKANSGIVVHSYYKSRKKWIANCQTRHLICILMEKLFEKND